MTPTEKRTLLHECAHAPTETKRLSAAQRLACALDEHDGAMIPNLFALLDDQQEMIRCFAVAGIGRIGLTSESRLRLWLKMEDPSAEVRATVVTVLGSSSFTNDRQRDCLLKGLIDRDVRVRITAARFVCERKILIRNAITVLISSLECPDTSVQIEAARVLGGLGALAQAAISPLLKCCEAGKPHVQVEAAAALSKITKDEDSYLEYLLDCAHSTDRTIRLKAIKALATTGSVQSRVVEVFNEGLLTEQDTSLRRECVEALGGLATVEPSCLASLVAALQDIDPSIRAKAAQYVSRVEGVPRAAVEALVECASRERNLQTHREIVAALERLRGQDAQGTV